jgi:hypothetical protein
MTHATARALTTDTAPMESAVAAVMAGTVVIGRRATAAELALIDGAVGLSSLRAGACISP